MTRRHWAGLALVVLTGSGCAAGEPPGGEDVAEARAGARGDRVRVAGPLQQKWGITVGPAERAELAGSVTLPGVLRLDEQHTVQITSLLAGTVVSLAVELGAEVRAREVVATLRAPAFAQAKTAFLQAAAKMNLERAEYERGRTLLQQEAIDQRELLQRQTAFESASREFDAAESHLHSFGLDEAAVHELLERSRRPHDGAPHRDLADPYLAIASPIAGRVIARDVITGQHVEPGRILFIVSDLSTLWAVLDAREADLPSLSTGRPVGIRTTVYPDRTWDGRILHVGDVVDETSRTVKVRVATRNDGLLLKPNMFVQGDIPDGAGSRDVITLPEEAIQTINGNPMVFVRVAPDEFAATPVDLGAVVRGRRVIARGLDGSEPVALTGAFNLKAELLKSSLAGE